MPDSFFTPCPVLIHNNIAFFNTYRNDNSNDPNAYWFTLNPYASEQDDTHCFDVRDFKQLIKLQPSSRLSNQDKLDILYALAENPSHLPREEGETYDDLSFLGSGFYRTTPDQDAACHLVSKISAHFDNAWPSARSWTVSMSDAHTKTVYLVPNAKDPMDEMSYKLICYDREISPYDFQPLITEPPDKEISLCGFNYGSLMRGCCEVLEVPMPDHLRQPLDSKLSAALEQAGQEEPTCPERNTFSR